MDRTYEMADHRYEAGCMDRTHEMASHRYPHESWPFPTVDHVELAPMHESTTAYFQLTRPSTYAYPVTYTATNLTTRQRRCNVCFVWMDFDRFHRDAYAPEGIGYTCKVCKCEKNRQIWQQTKNAA